MVKTRKVTWRDFLTPKERAYIVRSDKAAADLEAAKETFRRTFYDRHLIVNQAVQRARYAARRARAAIKEASDG